MEKVRRLNIGCGDNIKEGYINLDIERLNGVDICHNLNQFPYPFENNSFDFILAEDVLEHLDNVAGFMKECYRILKPSGKIKIMVPHFSSSVAFIDVQHKHFFGYNSLDFFVKGKRANIHEGGGIFFSSLKKKIFFGKKYNLINYLIQPFANKFPLIYEASFLRNLFPALRVEYILIK